jgi:hypothetical protein
VISTFLIGAFLLGGQLAGKTPVRARAMPATIIKAGIPWRHIPRNDGLVFEPFPE